MSSSTIPLPSVRRLRALTDVAVVIAGSLVIAACAQISVPLWPVPVSGQTLAVLLVAGLLGAKRGTAAIVLYLTEGAAGLPFFASGRFGLAVITGPTGGYLLGFVLAAWIVGMLADSGVLRRPGVALLTMVGGHLVIYAAGLCWLSRFVGRGSLLGVGLMPFIAGDLLKSLLAALAVALPAQRNRTGKANRQLGFMHQRQ
jgi:biotin transport system substrate-specific component